MSRPGREMIITIFKVPVKYPDTLGVLVTVMVPACAEIIDCIFHENDVSLFVLMDANQPPDYSWEFVCQPRDKRFGLADDQILEHVKSCDLGLRHLFRIHEHLFYVPIEKPNQLPERKTS